MEKKDNQNSAKQDILHRVRVLYTIFILIGIGVAARLLWVQFISPDVKHNAAVMRKGVFITDQLEAHRGAILSRSGEPLAMSSFRYYPLFDFASEGFTEASPEAIKKNVDSLSYMLANYFSREDAEREGYTHITAKEYRDIFYDLIAEGKERGGAIFPRKVTLDEWNIMKKRFPILNYSLGQVYSRKNDDERIYPYGDLAYQTIGRTDEYALIDGQRMKTTPFGIEHIYEERLKGIKGRVAKQRIAHGFWVRVDDKDNASPVDGCDVVTTIDAGLQKIAAERLREMLVKQHASFGVAMVMEASTGNLLCMVNLSSGAERGENYDEYFYNHALGTAITPGSTLKLASAMALLEIGGFTLDTQINTEHSNGSKPVKVGYANVYDTHDAGAETDGLVTLRDGFAHSSNVFFAKSVYESFKDDPVKYTSYLEKLLFNSHVGMQKYGEAKGRLPLADSPAWNKGGNTGTRLPILAYGYEVELPPIHMLTFYNGVANDGRMVAPRIVDHIERNGEVVERMPVVTLIDKMCSESTVSALRECLSAASAPRFTAHSLLGLPVEVGCKTGTTQIFGKFLSRGTIDKQIFARGLKKDDKYYMGSMVAMFPIENPKYTVMVCVAKQCTDEHSTYYGASVAGPVVRDIIDYVYTNDPALHAPVSHAETPYAPRVIKAGDSDAVGVVCRELSTSTTVSEKKSAWSGVAVDEAGNATISPRTITEGLLPNVVGMGLTDALYLLESAGLEVTHSGSGRVVRQSVTGGTQLNRCSRSIHLTLER